MATPWACSEPQTRSARVPAASRFDEGWMVAPNLDDDDGDGVADALDSVVSGDADVYDLCILPAKMFSADGEFATVAVAIDPPWSGCGNVFLRQGGRYTLHRGVEDKITKGDFASVNAVAVEVNDFASRERPPRVVVRAEDFDADGKRVGTTTKDLEVARCVLDGYLDPADALFVVNTKSTADFIARLAPLAAEAGVRLSPVDLPPSTGRGGMDIWMQDATEIGFTWVGNRLQRVAIHGNRGRTLDELIAKQFLGRDRAVIRKGGFRGEEAQWIDWVGNLETSPPTVVNHKEYPMGRIHAGTQGPRTMHPDVLAFLDAQGIQGPPLILDTSWLVIGHVDEMISFVPSTHGHPWRMLLASPRLAVELLRKAEAAAPGGTIQRGTKSTRGRDYERPVARVLEDRALLEEQELYQKKLDAVRAAVREGLGVAEENIIDIPVLFHARGDFYKNRAFAETPDMVNCLVLGRTVIVPDPHGPLVNGKDVLLEDVCRKLAPLGCNVRAIDDFDPYHLGGGEVHCGTNAARRPAIPLR